MAYTFTQRKLPNTFYPEALYVYNTPAHLLLQSKAGWIVFEILDPKSSVCVRICVNIKRKVAVSPVRAPFGSCEIYTKVSSAVLERFLVFVEQTLQQKKVKQFVIKAWPELYQTSYSSQVKKVWISKLKFKPTSEVSSIIQVNRNSLQARMKISERQKAVKAARLFAFNQCQSDEYETVYDFILSCRKERKQTLSLSWKQLQQTIAVLPDRFLFFSLTTESDLAAAAIVIRVSDTIWYTFYYAHASRFNKVSPVVYLLSCIYEQAKKEKVKIIDLGTSMINDEINKPLLHFKQSIGTITNLKFTFSKSYS